ncbi:hypothetical protein SEA_ARCHIMEDES_32 [Gordonia phage Archimedes]|uniref:Uncharacterized protein n=1 Tax=Gordonia phage Archimedes TaxID=2759389 RepID=A0A7L7SH22_9CAUD|nr:hypothetical protein KCH38_gp32 [Gordonia phage Archimedes]QOC55732.1 hypothetical protein SEA_ARCHIMEDES_32 [Gordonia phage Archimedes]
MAKNTNKLVKRAEALEREAAKLRETIVAMSDLIDEPTENGSVVGFSKRFRQTTETATLVAGPFASTRPYDYYLQPHTNEVLSRQYDYAAIRSGNHWYVSGPKDGARRFTWNQLLEFVGEDYWHTVQVLRVGNDTSTEGE